VRILGAVVLAHAAGSVATRESHEARRRAVGCELIGDDRLRMDSLGLQFVQQLQRGRLVAALLDQHVQHLAFIVAILASHLV